MGDKNSKQKVKAKHKDIVVDSRYMLQTPNHTAIDSDQPDLLHSIAHEKPSKQHKSDLYVCRIYRRSGGDCQIYEDVKHCWWTADSSVLVIVQYTNPERTQWRNVSWLREVIDWYTLTHAEFE